MNNRSNNRINNENELKKNHTQMHNSNKQYWGKEVRSFVCESIYAMFKNTKLMHDVSEKNSEWLWNGQKKKKKKESWISSQWNKGHCSTQLSELSGSIRAFHGLWPTW